MPWDSLYGHKIWRNVQNGNSTSQALFPLVLTEIKVLRTRKFHVGLLRELIAIAVNIYRTETCYSFQRYLAQSLGKDCEHLLTCRLLVS